LKEGRYESFQGRNDYVNTQMSYQRRLSREHQPNSRGSELLNNSLRKPKFSGTLQLHPKDLVITETTTKPIEEEKQLPNEEKVTLENEKPPLYPTSKVEKKVAVGLSGGYVSTSTAVDTKYTGSQTGLFIKSKYDPYVPNLREPMTTLNVSQKRSQIESGHSRGLGTSTHQQEYRQPRGQTYTAAARSLLHSGGGFAERKKTFLGQSGLDICGKRPLTVLEQLRWNNRFP